MARLASEDSCEVRAASDAIRRASIGAALQAFYLPSSKKAQSICMKIKRAGPVP
jgi:hypothetical protein